MGKSNKIYTVATVFSGIGAFEYSLKRQGINFRVAFACDCGDRKIDLNENITKTWKHLESSQKSKVVEAFYNSLPKENRIKETYFKNHEIVDSRWFSDVRFLDGTPFVNKVDFFVGGSPCQSFSLMGKRKGLDDTRGTLFYEFARLVKEIKPKVFIYENVPGMLIHDKKKTWETVKFVFDSLGYHVYFETLNAADYGIPQSRKRLFVIGFLSKPKKEFRFPKPIPLKLNTFDLLDKNVPPKYYLKEKGFKFVTSKKNRGRAKINSMIIRTEKRNQQFNWNGDFIFEPISAVSNDVLKQAFVGMYDGELGVVRKLTPRECHRLMGFGEDFKIDEHDIDAYKQSGNSIVVNVLSVLIEEILKVLDD